MSTQQQPVQNIESLVDFHENWPEMRPLAQSILQQIVLEEGQAETLSWLIKLADRVTHQDFK